ncbi:hypothetical protein LO767_11645 [Halopseudomonas aestusnigri]|uniref:hypothetical protein n=1 Tax=Halopseudomonas aestusnigri TaxID=857252 RepID=UPI000C3A2315|nr:hypothetical protein [Halopseudomonas aestusnigri]MAD27215.1 hypothetical protein [Pseudomonadales bacterium]MAS66242.1 hypothetical protein [Pseudomonadales bacterium]MCC4259499.1 hypothetical protein [Halopseudomonas aestusnigri]UGV29666.1 hypothetical protein LO767_11645 [Halopseudomonas aestusnigri]
MSTHPNIGSKEVIGELRQKLNACVLPITRDQQRQLVEQLEGDLLSINELTQAIMRAPVAALHICRAAGAAARNRDVDVLTLEQACSLLGTQRIADLLKGIPVVEPDQLPWAYRQLLSISEHAVSQAQGLFANRIARLWHEMSLATLLFLSPLWTLAYLKPHLFEQWERLNDGVLPDGVSRRQIADTTANGFQLVQLVAQDWWLPPWILQGYRSLNANRRTMVKALRVARDSAHPQEQQAQLDGDRELYRWLTQPANSALIANGMALGTHHSWYNRHTSRWQKLSALYLNIEVADAQRLTHENAVNSAHDQFTRCSNDIFLPASTLPQPPPATSKTPAACTGAPPKAQPEPARPEPRSADPDLWRSLCLRLSKQPDSFGNLAQLLECAQHALIKGLGLTTCWIALSSARNHQLVIAVASGFASGQPLSGTAVGSSREGHWPAWLRSASCHEVQPQQAPGAMPEKVLELGAGSIFYLAPLTHNEQLVGLIYVSNGSPQPLDSKRQQAVVKTAECLHKALLHLKQRA